MNGPEPLLTSGVTGTEGVIEIDYYRPGIGNGIVSVDDLLRVLIRTPKTVAACFVGRLLFFEFLLDFFGFGDGALANYAACSSAIYFIRSFRC